MNRFAPSATREDIRLRRESLARDRALLARDARCYVIEHPGCTTQEVFKATGAGSRILQHLSWLGCVYKKQPREMVDGRIKPVEHWYPRDMKETAGAEK